MKITKFSAENVGAIKSAGFETSGNVTISGRNGTGKTTLCKALMWCLAGNTSDGEKLITRNGDDMPSVTVEVSDGGVITTIHKELERRVDLKGVVSIKSKCELNGIPADTKDLKSWIESKMPLDIWTLMMRPATFFSGTVMEQRAFLMRHFSKVDVEGTLAEIERNKKKLKSLKEKMNRNEIKIQTLSEEIITDESVILQEIKFKEELLLFVEDGAKERAAALSAKSELKRQEAALESKRRELAMVRDRLVAMRQAWHEAERKCPMCRQTLNAEVTRKVRAELAEKGKELRRQEDALKGEVYSLEKEVASKKSEVAMYVNEALTDESCDKITPQLIGIKSRLNELNFILKRNRERVEKVSELKAEMKAIGQEMSDVEGEVQRLEVTFSEQMKEVSEGINSHFNYIKFQLFEKQKSGRVEKACEAVMKGVPYRLLSKGEKLQAVLDMKGALERYYEVEVPVILDDAESYTSNVLEKVANQTIKLKVTESEKLTIESGVE